jgi:hypothetical protein
MKRVKETVPKSQNPRRNEPVTTPRRAGIIDLLQKKGLIPLSPPDYPPPVPLPKGEARGINILFPGGFKEFCKKSNRGGDALIKGKE